MGVCVWRLALESVCERRSDWVSDCAQRPLLLFSPCHCTVFVRRCSSTFILTYASVMVLLCSQNEWQKQCERNKAKHTRVLCRMMRRRSLSKAFAVWEQYLHSPRPSEKTIQAVAKTEEKEASAAKWEVQRLRQVAEDCCAACSKTLASDLAHGLHMAQVEVDALFALQLMGCELELLQQSMYRWSSWLAMCRRYSSLLKRHCLHSRLRSQTGALHQWQHQVMRKQAHQAQLVQYLLRGLRRSVARAWRSWCRFYVSSRNLGVSYRRVQLRGLSLCCLQVFSRWAEFAKLQEQEVSRSWKSDCINVVVDADGSLIISDNEHSTHRAKASADSRNQAQVEWLLQALHLETCEEPSCDGPSPSPAWFDPSKILKSFQSQRHLSRLQRDEAVLQLSTNDDSTKFVGGHSHVGATRALETSPFGEGSRTSFSRTSLQEWTISEWRQQEQVSEIGNVSAQESQHVRQQRPQEQGDGDFLPLSPISCVSQV